MLPGDGFTPGYLHPSAGDAPTPLAGVERRFITSNGNPNHPAPTPLAGVERGFVTRNARALPAPTPLAGVERRFVPVLVMNLRPTPASGVGRIASQHM